jgi:putative resolvase
MKLSEWCKKQGIKYQTGYHWFKRGELPEARQMPSGTILVEPSVITDRDTFIYTRVSKESFADDLEIQEKICVQFCKNNGIQVDKIFKEIGPGINIERKNRKVLWDILDARPKRIIVASLDRLTIFCREFIEKLFQEIGCEIIAVERDRAINRREIRQELASLVTKEMTSDDFDLSMDVDSDNDPDNLY